LEDFGLKESLEGMGGLGYQYASKLRESSSNNNNNNNTSSHTNPASEPLLENNYGMDAELGTDRNIASSPNPNPNQSSNDRKFVLLETFRVKKDGWGAVANLDLFFTSLYNYYYHGGLVPIIGKGIVELISLFFTLWLSVFLFVYLDWQALWKCRDEDSCRPNLSSYMVDNVS
jgi:autophagy-related protein 9